MPYRRRDVVVTLFPFADGHSAKERPALVCAGPWRIGPTIEVCWVAMITTTVLKGWPGDTDIPNLIKTGLPVPSIVRTLKLACIDTRNITKKAGLLDLKTFRAAERQIRAHMK
jgi:mRNA interferase MazF